MHKTMNNMQSLLVIIQMNKIWKIKKNKYSLGYVTDLFIPVCNKQKTGKIMQFLQLLFIYLFIYLFKPRRQRPLALVYNRLHIFTGYILFISLDLIINTIILLILSG